jgi:hypothetical protein
VKRKIKKIFENKIDGIFAIEERLDTALRLALKDLKFQKIFQ